MSEKFENTKMTLENVNHILEIKNNSVVKSTIINILKAVPVIGELIDDCVEEILSDFQLEKRNELISIIIEDGEHITSDRINDVEFIINFTKTLEAVNRLSNNDKVKYFANLLKNGYLKDEKIENDLFEENLSVLSTLSFRQINYLLFINDFEMKNINSYKEDKYYNIMNQAFCEEFNLNTRDYSSYGIFKRLCATGFLEEALKGDEPVIYHNTPKHEYDNEFTMEPIYVDTEYFYIADSFKSLANFIQNQKGGKVDE